MIIDTHKLGYLAINSVFKMTLSRDLVDFEGRYKSYIKSTLPKKSLKEKSLDTINALKENAKEFGSYLYNNSPHNVLCDSLGKASEVIALGKNKINYLAQPENVYEKELSSVKSFSELKRQFTALKEEIDTLYFYGKRTKRIEALHNLTNKITKEFNTSEKYLQKINDKSRKALEIKIINR